MGFHIHSQALGSGVVCRFDLNGDELAFSLDNEVDLGTTVRLPVVGGVTVDSQLHLDIVF